MALVVCDPIPEFSSEILWFISKITYPAAAGCATAYDRRCEANNRSHDREDDNAPQQGNNGFQSAAAIH